MSSPQLPKTYKAVVIQKANAPLELTDVELQLPKPGQVLVKSIACGVCASDIAVWQGHMGNEFPRVPGHELIGEVVAVPEGETRWKVGDRVGAPWHGGHDGTCKQCKRGQYQMCQNESVNGVSMDGGWAEYALLNKEALVDIPRNLDPTEIAPLLCAGVTVFNSIRNQRVPQGGVVGILGLGGLGHLALQYSSKMGYRTVALSSGPDKKDFAMKLGAHDYVDGKAEDPVKVLQSMGGADIIVCTAPNPKAIEPLLNGVAPGGKLLIISPVGEITINTLPMILKNISVLGFPSGHVLDSEEAIAFAETHNVKVMVEKYPLKDFQKAVDQVTSGKVRFRAVLTM